MILKKWNTPFHVRLCPYKLLNDSHHLTIRGGWRNIKSLKYIKIKTS